MRLHRLTLSAFGPFAAAQTVDFDTLSGAGLFLLHGPTGGGKTSVLDAVCFALYGQVPGVRPATRLRSDHAEPGTPTEVVLDVTLGGRRLEITRRPEQPRAKKRGSGVTVERAVTLLREHTEGQWRALSKSHQEVGEEIRQLVGMSCEQFCQVVLLPQGEFATFLRAGATERAALLGRLFDTRRFRSVEQRLRDRKYEAAQRLVEGDRELARLAAQLRQAAGPGDEPSDGPADLTDPAELLAHAAVLRATAREQYAVAHVTVGLAESAHTAATAAAERTRELHALQQRYAEARDRAAALTGLAAQRTAARTALTRAQRATTVEPALTHRAKASARHAEAVDLERTALAALPGAGVPGVSGEDAGPAADGPGGRVPAARSAVRVWREKELAQRAGELREVLGGLAAGEEAEARVREVTARRTVLEREERDDEDAQREADAWLADWPRVRGALRARLDSGLEAVARAGDLAGELAAARQRRDAAAERDTLTARLARAEQEERDARDRAADAREAWQDLREQRVTGLAAELAAGLADGEPCRVCGSTAHPDPARAAARHVTKADEDAAYAGFQRRTATYDQTHEAVVRSRTALDAATALAGSAPRPELAAACAALEAEHAAATRTAATVPDARAELAAAEQERDRRAATQQAALHRAAARTSRREELDAQYARLTGDLAAARAGHADVTSRRAHLTRALAHLDRAAHAVRERADSARRLAEAEAALTEAVSRAGFGDAREAAAALLPAPRLWDAERQAAAWSREESATEAALTAATAALMPAVRAAAAQGDPAAAGGGHRAAPGPARTTTPPGGTGPAEPAAPAPGPHPAAGHDDLAPAGTGPAEPAGATEAEPDGDLRHALPPADPAAARATADDANLRLRRASAAESAARTRCVELDRLSAEATAAVRRLGPARAGYSRTARLADLVSATSAENQYRMELETYVLAARLEQVAAAAGMRLQRMSGGRYTLVHSDARGGGRTKSGLGLMVVDAWTGTERDTATLSGGETFYASLALALGLADVVTDEAGGMRLDTLFIDEGFGSLDEEALDEVLDVLDGLRERDRAVGIVSHVADLRDRIPARLHVTKGRDGSTLRMRAR